MGIPRWHDAAWEEFLSRTTSDGKVHFAAFRMTARGKTDRGAKVRNNANREIGVPRGGVACGVGYPLRR